MWRLESGVWCMASGISRPTPSWLTDCQCPRRTATQAKSIRSESASRVPISTRSTAGSWRRGWCSLLRSPSRTHTHTHTRTHTHAHTRTQAHTHTHTHTHTRTHTRTSTNHVSHLSSLPSAVGARTESSPTNALTTSLPRCHGTQLFAL
jgi:hypothetical protein